jgi:hypothetical protein
MSTDDGPGPVATAMSADEGPGPVAAATARLVAWLESVAGVPVRTGPPGSEGETVLSAYALALLPAQELRTSGGSQPLRFQVRFLVSAQGPVDGATRTLDRVLVASVDAADLPIQLKPLAAELWTALGAPPRPAFLVDLPAKVERRGPMVPRVRMPLQVRDVALRGVDGQVIGAGDVPLSGVRVELASTGAATYTNARGGFTFSAVPADEPVRLLLTAKGRALWAEFAAADAHDPGAGPLVIHCDLEEV